jgi:hypothetical protein
VSVLPVKAVEAEVVSEAAEAEVVHVVVEAVEDTAVREVDGKSPSH